MTEEHKKIVENIADPNTPISLYDSILLYSKCATYVNECELFFKDDQGLIRKMAFMVGALANASLPRPREGDKIAELEARIKELTKWVSVEDRLPEIGELVLLKCKMPHSVNIQTGSLRETGEWHNGSCYMPCEHFTHWRKI